MAREANMTRKHFGLICDIINGLALGPEYGPDARLRRQIADQFAKALGEHYSFDHDLFVAQATRRDAKERSVGKDPALALGYGKILIKGGAAAVEICDFHPDDKMPDLYMPK